MSCSTHPVRTFRTIFKLAIVLAFWLAVANYPLSADKEADALNAVKLPGEMAQVANRLADARKRAEKKQWAEAIEEYQRVLDESGDALVPLDPRKPMHCLPARRLCQVQMAALDPAGLRVYRKRVDDTAGKWLKEGSTNRDVKLLRRVVDEAFCSSHGDKALDLLGDLAFENGDFLEAEQWWRMIALPASQVGKAAAADASLIPVYPDPHVDVALVRAKQVLCRIYLGDRTAAAEEIKAYTALHEKAAGRLAGRDGNYLTILQDVLGKADALVPRWDARRWPTFAGDASRNGIPPKEPRIRWLDEPWRIPLDVDRKKDLEKNRKKELTPAKFQTATQAAKSTATYPAIVGDYVVTADDRSLRVRDLTTGELKAKCDLNDNQDYKGLDAAQKLPLPYDARFSVTVEGKRVYARMGTIPLGPPGAKSENKCSYLFCFDLAQVSEERLVPRWQLMTQTDAKEAVYFEGAPAVRDGRVYIARTSFKGDRAATSLLCCDADSGALRWQQDVCEGDEGRGTEPRYRHRLVTLAGPNVVYASHAGAIVALDAVTGKRAWAVRYPSRGQRGEEGANPFRDLSPCLFAEGRIYVAPGDYDRIICLDSGTGRLLWENGPIEVGQLLGVGHGKLIFTTAAAPRGIRGIDAKTGKDLRAWLQPDGGQDLPTIGRGLLVGDKVWWPTRDGLRILQQEDGQPPATGFTPLDGVPPGNLALGNGCLVIATSTELIGYVPPARRLNERKKDALRLPQSAVPQLRLGLALADSGKLQDALDAFQAASKLAKDDERWQGEPLREYLLRRRHELLLGLADQESEQKRWDQAAAQLQKAASTEFPVALRLQAVAAEATLWERAGLPAKAVQAWQSILGADDLCFGRLEVDGLLQPTNLWAAKKIDALIRKHGRECYALAEARAADLTGNGTRPKEEIAERLAKEFPNAKATRQLLASTFAAALKENRPDMVDLARWLCRASWEPRDRALVLAGFADACERQHCWEATRHALQQLREEFGREKIAELDPTRSVTEYVAGRLESPDLKKKPPALGFNLQFPLSRVWEDVQATKAQPGGTRLLLPGEGSMQSSRDDYLLTCRGATLTCRAAAKGALRWEKSLDRAPTWATQSGDLALVGGEHGVFAASLYSGRVAWAYKNDEAFTLAELRCYQLQDGCLNFMEDGRRFVALDAETGQMLWSRWAPGARVSETGPAPKWETGIYSAAQIRGQFHPHYWSGQGRLIVQTSSGRLWLLDGRTGKLLHDLETSTSPWPTAPVVADDRHIVIASEPGKFILLDVDKGKPVWTHNVKGKVGLSGEAPVLLVRGQHVLAFTPRNWSFSLEKLDLRTGKRAWPDPIMLDRDELDTGSITADANSLFYVGHGVLHARTIRDGKEAWRAPLQNSSRNAAWRLECCHGHVIAWTKQALLDGSIGPELRRSLAFDPTSVLPTRLPLTVSKAPIAFRAAKLQSQLPSMLSVWVIEAATGQLVQRLNFTAHGPDAGLAIFHSRVAVVMNGSTWGLQ